MKLLTVIGQPFATGESIGLPTEEGDGTAWLMNEGELGAHIMIGSPPGQ